MHLLQSQPSGVLEHLQFYFQLSCTQNVAGHAGCHHCVMYSLHESLPLLLQEGLIGGVPRDHSHHSRGI